MSREGFCTEGSRRVPRRRFREVVRVRLLPRVDLDFGKFELEVFGPIYSIRAIPIRIPIFNVLLSFPINNSDLDPGWFSRHFFLERFEWLLLKVPSALSGPLLYRYIYVYPVRYARKAATVPKNWKLELRAETLSLQWRRKSKHRMRHSRGSCIENAFGNLWNFFQNRPQNDTKFLKNRPLELSWSTLGTLLAPRWPKSDTKSKI